VKAFIRRHTWHTYHVQLTSEGDQNWYLFNVHYKEALTCVWIELLVRNLDWFIAVTGMLSYESSANLSFADVAGSSRSRNEKSSQTFAEAVDGSGWFIEKRKFWTVVNNRVLCTGLWMSTVLSYWVLSIVLVRS